MRYGKDMATIFPEPIFPLDPLTMFMLVLFMVLFLPRVFERFKLPGIVGLILGGLILGPKGYGVIDPGDTIMKFLSDVGKLMVMFFAGLEIDIDRFTRSGHKSLTYGLATFLIPLGAGLLIARLFGLSWNAAVLVGSLLASHTLLALPILIKSRMIKRESVMVTIGATMFTDVAALVVLAVCIAIHTVGFSASVLAVRFAGMAIFIPLFLLGARYLSPFFLSHMKEREDSQTLFILFLMIFAAVCAETIHLEGIVGAFIVGLAVGGVVHDGPVRRRLNTLGNTLFVPAFFLLIGALVDPLSFLRLSPSALGLMVCIIIGLILAKLMAAMLAGRILGYSRNEQLCMWSLSIPQVAATLAAALVAFETLNSAGERLIGEEILDGILILVMVTVILGPLLTQIFVKHMQKEQRSLERKT